MMKSQPLLDFSGARRALGRQAPSHGALRLSVLGVLAGLAFAPLAVAQTVQGTQAAQTTRAAQATQATQTVQAGRANAAATRAAQATQAAPATAGSAGSRFLEACQAAAQSGQYLPGCTPPQMPGRELEQLKQEALRTRNPQLMTLVGEAYQRQRAGMGDISQAYRWYVLGAVRGDPQAMTRLSEMYRRGQGTAPDRVRALGYAQLAQRVAPDSAAGKQAAQTVRALRKSMASSELAQADRFAEELAQQMSRGTPGHEAPGPWGLPHMAAPAPVLGGQRLPGAHQMAVAAPGLAQGSGSAAAAQKAAPGTAQSGGAWATMVGPVPGYAPPPVGASVLPGQMAAMPAAASALPVDGRGPVVGATGAGAAAGVPAGAARGKRGSHARQPVPAVPTAPVAPVPAVPHAPVELRPAAPSPAAAPAEAAASAAVPAVQQQVAP